MRKLVLLACISVACVASAYAQFTFTNIECPGSTLTTARGINNNGEIVGSYSTGGGRHASLIKNGQCTFLAPTTVLGTNYSDAWKNNDAGDVVGVFRDNAGTPHGFFLSKKGVLTQLDFPGAGDTTALGINESGTVVGYFEVYDSQGNFIASHGFTWNGGKFTQVDFPGAVDTTLAGINASGDMVGWWDAGPAATVVHGFVLSKKGQFINFDVPVNGATVTQLDDINANGQIVGEYNDAAGNEHGFLQEGAAFTSFDFPGSVITAAWGINSRGEIVGDYFPNDNQVFGFLAVADK